VRSLIMRSIPPTLRFTRVLRQYNPSPLIHTPRSSIFSPRSPSLRFYSEQRESENSKSQENKENKENSKENFKEDTSPPPDPDKSPFQVFVDTFKSELSKSRELQESVKALQDESGKIGDSEALRRAKDAYAKAKVHYFATPVLTSGTF
jgi:hypothetical protein